MKTRITIPILISFILLSACNSTNNSSRNSSDFPGNPSASITVSQDETLVYILRRWSFVGGGAGYWIATNDMVTGRITNGNHTELRFKSGLNTITMSARGMIYAQQEVDDRAGETVYLLFNPNDRTLEEVSSSYGSEFVSDTDRMGDIDEPRSFNEYRLSILNLGNMGFELMQPRQENLLADNETAVITFFRRRESDGLDVSVWGSNGYLGDLESEESFQTKVSPGEHFFFAGNTGTSTLRAEVDAGKYYYVWIDVGSTVRNVEFRPVTVDESRNLSKWIDSATPLELDKQGLSERILQRSEIMNTYYNQAVSLINSGNEPVNLTRVDGYNEPI